MKRLFNKQKALFRRTFLILLILTFVAPISGLLLIQNKASAAYNLQKADFGIAPGAGFLLDADDLTRGLDDFKELGVHWIRSTIPWKNFQPNGPSTHNWNAVDDFMDTINSAPYAGRFKFIITIESPPDWAKVPSNITHINCTEQPPFDLDSYARAAAGLANHLGNLASVYEVENSPNISPAGDGNDGNGVWPHPNPCGYTELLKLTNFAIHYARPTATVLVGGLGGVRNVPGERIAGDDFLWALYYLGAKGNFDGVSYHPYSTPEFPCAPSDSICVFNPNTSMSDPYGMKNGWDRMLNARNTMVANGDGNKLIWATEFGGPTNGPAGSPNVLTETGQAYLLGAGFQRASQYSWLGPLCWFTYRDQGTNPETDPSGDWMGLVRSNYTRKPAFTVYHNLVDQAN